MSVRSREHCIRCGECCLKSSPTLLESDLPLIENQIIKYREIYTIREGELVNDNIKEVPAFTKNELIKIKEKNGVKGGCIFYSERDKSCSIYSHRPTQCSAFKCWETNEFMDVYKGSKLDRIDLIKDSVLLGLIKEHGKRCGYSTIKGYVEEIEDQGERVLDKIIDILKFDHQIRPFISQKMQLDPEQMDLYFGRPLTETIAMFGLQVIKENDGAFLLTIKS
jgi:Fe-S-cluster containining protein